MKRFTTYPHMSQAELNQEVWDACFNGDLEQLKYVLHSPELKKHGDIYYDNGDCFYWAYEKKHMDVVDYLLSEEKYAMTDKLKKTCEDNFLFARLRGEKRVSVDELNFLFEKRDLYLKLKNLPAKNSTKGMKI